MNIALCDDEAAELEKVRKVVDRFAAARKDTHFFAIHAFTDGDEILRASARQERFELIILDVVMPGLNGIELAEEIRSYDKNCRIIFLTSSPEFAVDSYKVGAFYYLLKPFDDVALEALLARAFHEIDREQSASIVVKERGKLTRVQIYAIKYVEIVGHNIFFHLRNGEILGCYGSLTEFQEMLLSDKSFIQCHRAFIVNMSTVASISGKEFILEDKTLIPISKKVYPQVKNAYIDHFFNKKDGLA